jgi:hypothetical protein
VRQAFQGPSTYLRLLEHRSEGLQSAAKNTSQSVDYCLKNEMLGLGPNTIAPALMIAVSHLGDMPGDWRREFL